MRDHFLYFPDEDDLVDVVDEVIDLAAKWRPLGFALRLKSAVLDTIYSNHPNDTTECDFCMCTLSEVHVLCSVTSKYKTSVSKSDLMWE